jgi:hypothetical protein
MIRDFSASFVSTFLYFACLRRTQQFLSFISGKKKETGERRAASFLPPGHMREELTAPDLST